jgi:fumarylacetoacetate (FAA) hydrolase family protein
MSMPPVISSETGASRAEIVGATLGNDVNLRDFEGRSALLPGKAKDNNASASVGPFIRLFDSTFGLDDVRAAELSLRVEGTDGYVLTGESSMKRISWKSVRTRCASDGLSSSIPGRDDALSGDVVCTHCRS